MNETELKTALASSAPFYINQPSDGALLMGPEGAFITGSDFLMDGGVTAAYWFGDLAPK
jgi:hypothetical protein